MRRNLASLALVITATALALHAGFPRSGCGPLAFAEPPIGTVPPPAAPPKPDEPLSPVPPVPPMQEVTLKVGDKAPALKADKWVKGAEVKSLDVGHVYLVEFWATWCPPCREAIPHLTKAQQTFKSDLTVVGVAGSERKADKGEDKRLEKLEAFVKNQGEKMDYTVAYDKDRKMVDSWMRAAGRDSIPTAFIVDRDGRIAWIGEPNDPEFDRAVERAVKGAKKS